MHMLLVSLDEHAQLTNQRIRISIPGLVVFWPVGFVHSLFYYICIVRRSPYKDIAPILCLESATSMKCINSELKKINSRRRASIKRRGASNEFGNNKTGLQQIYK